MDQGFCAERREPYGYDPGNVYPYNCVSPSRRRERRLKTARPAAFSVGKYLKQYLRFFPRTGFLLTLCYIYI